MSPKRIWLLLDSKGFGGIESHIEQLALGITHQTQHQVTVVWLQDHGEHPLILRLNAQGIAWLKLDGQISSLWQQLKTNRPDVVHTHGYKAGIWARPLAALLGIRCLSTFHSGEQKHGKLAWYDRLDRYSAFLAAKVYAVSPEILATLPCHAELKRNFIDCDSATLSLAPLTHNIAFVGRLSPEKAPARFIYLARQFPQLHFHLYGDGALRGELAATAPSNVIFHGAKPSMTPYWPQIGLLILPSDAEGLPMAALEAMRVGISVVAFDVGALPDLITPEKDGWLLPLGDVAGLARSVNAWLALSDDERRRWQQRAQQKILTNYSTQAVLPAILKDYGM